MNKENELLEILDIIAAQLKRIAGALEKESSNKWQTTPEGLPICPRHNAVMRRREKQGDVWHSHTIPDPTTGEILYCRGYADKSSRGFDIATPQQQGSTKPAAASPSSGGNGGRGARRAQAARQPVKANGRMPKQTRPASPRDSLNDDLFG